MLCLVRARAGDVLDHLRKGANFGNYLEVPPDQNWALVHDANDVEHVKQEGFDHIRLPVGWHHYAGSAPEFRLKGEIFEKVDRIVTNALSRDLGIVINIHHFDEFTTNPSANTNKFYAIWKQIAEHYAGTSKRLAFELINEPKDAATTEVLNPIYSAAVGVIRKSNPDRVIILGPSRWNSLDEVPKLKLPKDKNVVVTVHCYDPFYFTHQGATWSGTDPLTTGLVYPGPPAKPLTPDPRAAKNKKVEQWFERYNTAPTAENPCSSKAYTARMERVAAWAREQGCSIYLGEFGAYTKADPDSRARYYSEMRKTAERLGFGWAIWDWKAGFKYWDGDHAVPGLHEALLGGN